MDLKLMGKRIKAARESAGLTQEQLAESIGVSTIHISTIERGAKPPKLETFIKIANVLKVSSDQLLQDCLDSALTAQANHLSCRLDELPEKEQKCLLSALESFLNTYNSDN